MEKDFIDDWVELIRPLFPKGARIETRRHGDVTISVDWKSGTDPLRPNRRFQVPEIAISEEAIEDCIDPKSSGEKFYQIIEESYELLKSEIENFEHADFRDSRWIISTDLIN